MYLLNVKTRKLEAFYDGNIPKYGILSHTWAQNEPTFDDFQSRTRRWTLRLKSDKINGCCNQAASDGLDYVWIDTCCIDKRSSAELSEAINSMFSWYARAAICYVYLSDVSPVARSQTRHAGSGPVVSAHALEPSQLEDIEKARWFTRGWTLQELLAPTMLKIYDSAWDFIGYSSRVDVNGGAGSSWGGPRLTYLLSDITGIPKKYLQDEDLSQASVAERMGWAAGRQTTRREDTAYCLLGIFGVNMPMLYGEGDGAFMRLQEEILKKHDDHSIFSWGFDDIVHSESVDRGSCVATSPADFRLCSYFTARRPENEPSCHYVMTNAGIYIELPLIQLQSGEFLARLNCTVDSSQPGILLEDKYLCLILTQSRERRNVFHRRSTMALTLIPLRFFDQTPRQGLYLAPSPPITYRIMRNGPLFVSATCAKAFTVQSTYPGIIDIQEGVYSLISDLWTGLRNGNGIFLDCVSITGEMFAIRVQVELEDEETEESGDLAASAHMSLFRRHHLYTMAELMLPPKVNETAERDWETDPVIEGYRVVLKPAETNQWMVDIVL